MKKIFTIAFALVFCCVSNAQGTSDVAMGFSAIPRDAESLALGGTSALKDVAMRPFDAEKLDAQVSYARWAPGSGTPSNDINVGIYGKIADKVGLNASFSLDSGQSYSIMDETGAAASSYSPKDMLLIVGASYKFLPFLSIGANFRYMNSNVAPEGKYSSCAGDVMLSGKVGPVRLGLGATALGGKVKAADGTEFGIPTAITFAGGYYDVFAGKHGIRANLQVDYFLKGGIRTGVGCSYTWNDMVSVRLGYNYGGKSVLPSFFSAGLGLKFYGFAFNAAFLFGAGPINSSMQFGIGYSF